MSVNEVKPPKAAELFTVKGSSSTPGCKTFCIGNEDHTLGNALRHVLINDPCVSFAGYSVPHPSEPVVHIRIQTFDPQRLPAMDALQSACQTLMDQGDIVLEALEQLLPHVREDRIQMEKFLMEDGYDDENANAGNGYDDENANAGYGDDIEEQEEEGGLQRFDP